MSFASDILNDVESTFEWVDKEITETFMNFGEVVVGYSPSEITGAQHAKGVFINSWYPAVNEFDETVGALPDKSGYGSLKRIWAVKYSKAFYKTDGFISLSNNLDYAGNVEYSGWPMPKWSGTVGPYAPVRNAITFMLGEYRK